MDLSRNFGDAVKRFWIASLAAAAVAAASTTAVYAQDGVDKARAAAFDKRMFAGPIGQKSSACFVRTPQAKSPRDEAAADGRKSTGRKEHQLFIPPRRQISRSRRRFR